MGLRSRLAGMGDVKGIRLQNPSSVAKKSWTLFSWNQSGVFHMCPKEIVFFLIKKLKYNSFTFFRYTAK